LTATCIARETEEGNISGVNRTVGEFCLASPFTCGTKTFPYFLSVIYDNISYSYLPNELICGYNLIYKVSVMSGSGIKTIAPVIAMRKYT
jgi:hypothetical protein